ncbi:MAG TPA: hypothetical protein VF666_04995 [Pyrinomonadaceae bacterium]|jgi:pimeloyl-ACP methyl ester carboxylesterase
MSPRRRAGRKLIKALLPILLLLTVAIVGFISWMVYGVVHPPQREYLVTPGGFVMSNRGPQATEETWTNADGTKARGWLLRGTEGAPAVIMLHRYGADRSWLLNLGVKLNETTNFTVLWPDLRGHGLNPSVNWSGFGSRESSDVLAALSYLRTLKTPQERPLISDRIGIYGVELGAYAALVAATTSEPNMRALALDSVPASPDELLHSAARNRTGLDNGFIHFLARIGTRVYFLGNYGDAPDACTAASNLRDADVLLLAGADAASLRDSTTTLAACFPNQSKVELRNDLPLTGYNLASAAGEQGEAYDRRVIEFFDRTLNNAP